MGLELIARQFSSVAIGWHLALGAVLLALAAGWRPKPRAAALLAAPAISVGVLAAATRNPFNACAFLALGMALLAIGATLRAPRVTTTSSPVVRAAGVALVAFGWLYPHFLESGATWRYLVAAPLGTIPCPTLSFLCGITLLGNGFESRAWRLILGGASLFYGLFGVAKLHVFIDAGLVAGAVMVLEPALRRARVSTHAPTASPR
jgi:hypothetical protein